MPPPSPLKTSAKLKAQDYGRRAEKLTAWYLRLKGYRILAERYRNHGGEIDLLAARGRTLCVVEVKARRNLDDCADSVPPFKQQKIMRAVEGLMASRGKIAGLAKVRERNIRFDVVWIARGRWPRHIKDAWRP